MFYDDDDEALPFLQAYVDSGFIELRSATHMDNRSFIFATDLSVRQGSKAEMFTLVYDKQQKMQLDAWRRFRKSNNPKRHVWIGQLDVDEFLPNLSDTKFVSHFFDVDEPYLQCNA